MVGGKKLLSNCTICTLAMSFVRNYFVYILFSALLIINFFLLISMLIVEFI